MSVWVNQHVVAHSIPLRGASEDDRHATKAALSVDEEAALRVELAEVTKEIIELKRLVHAKEQEKAVIEKKLGSTAAAKISNTLSKISENPAFVSISRHPLLTHSPPIQRAKDHGRSSICRREDMYAPLLFHPAIYSS